MSVIAYCPQAGSQCVRQGSWREDEFSLQEVTTPHYVRLMKISPAQLETTLGLGKPVPWFKQESSV